MNNTKYTLQRSFNQFLPDGGQGGTSMRYKKIIFVECRVPESVSVSESQSPRGQRPGALELQIWFEMGAKLNTTSGVHHF